METMILMKDLTWREARYVAEGDRLYTLNGRGGEVIAVERTVLGRFRRMARFEWSGGESLRISDDHDLWYLNEYGHQQWGTFNYNWWLLEAHQEGTGAVPSVPLVPGCEYHLATVDGWQRTSLEYDDYQDPEEKLLGFRLDDGAGFVAGGFVVIADGCMPGHMDVGSWDPPATVE
jgi:hypothetical protein